MKTELFIENNEVDLTEDVVVPITFTIADVKDISTRRTNFSKTIKVPGTKNNNKLFNHAYDVSNTTSPSGSSGDNIGVNFNRKKKADFLLLADGASILSGTAQLKSVDIVDGDITYNLVLFGELANIISTIGDSELTDLDASGLTHTFDIETVTGSWERTDYAYPLIDYGLLNTKMDSVTLENFRPAIFVSWYWDKIFEEAGFTYEGDFLDSNLFNSLIIPYNKIDYQLDDPVPSAVVTNNGFVSSSLSEFFPFNLVNEDPDSLYTASSATYTAPRDDNYEAYFQTPLTVGLNPENTGADGDTIVNNEFDIVYTVKKNGSDYSTIIRTIPEATYEETSSNGITPVRSYKFNFLGSEGNIPLSASDELRVSMRLSYTGSSAFKNIDDGDSDVAADVNGVSVAGNDEEFTLRIGSQYIEGSEVDGQRMLPTDVKQKDFLLGILRLFNLYVEQDANRPKHLIITQRDTYYSDFDTIDWTSKLDVSSQRSNRSLEEGLVKTLQFKYKDDEDDYYLNRYKTRWGKSYGEKRVNTGYEFNNEIRDVLKLPFGTLVPIQYSSANQIGDTLIEVVSGSANTINVSGYWQVSNSGSAEPGEDFTRFKRVGIGREVIIAGTTYEITDMINPWQFKVDSNVSGSSADLNPSQGYIARNVPFYYTSEADKVIPAIFKTEDNALTTEPYDSVLRIGLYSNTLSSFSWTIQQTPRKPDGFKDYVFNNSITKSVSVTEYPFLSHLSPSPTLATFDLLFEQPEELYFNL